MNDDTVPGSDQYCSWITLDRLQRPHVFWYDSRNYYPTNSGDIYYSWSEDGGLTWATNEQVNDVTPCYTEGSSSQMGDYQQIRCDSNYVYCSWSDHRNGHDDWSYIAAARRPLPELTAIAQDPGERKWQTSRFELGQNYPNPVVQGTEISFTAPEPSSVLLQIYDQSGRLVKPLLQQEVAAGTHRARWDGTDRNGRAVVPGVYFYRLQTGGSQTTRQMIVAR